MNLILLEGDQPSPRQCRHMVDVLGVDVGRRLRVGRRRGPRGWATVVAVDGDRVELAIESLDEPARAPATSLILAAPRPKVVPRLVAAAASLGVARIDLTRAWRVDKSYLSSPALSASSLDDAAVLGCEQGGHTWVPDIAVHPLFSPMLGGLELAPGALALIAHPGAGRSIEEAALDLAGRGRASRPPARSGNRDIGERPAVLAIGPEGGWIEREVEGFVARGFIAVRAGDAIMRSEVAVAALLAQLELLRRLSR